MKVRFEQPSLDIEVEKPSYLDHISKKLKFVGNLDESQKQRLKEILEAKQQRDDGDTQDPPEVDRSLTLPHSRIRGTYDHVDGSAGDVDISADTDTH